MIYKHVFKYSNLTIQSLSVICVCTYLLCISKHEPAANRAGTSKIIASGSQTAKKGKKQSTKATVKTAQYIAYVFIRRTLFIVYIYQLTWKAPIG